MYPINPVASLVLAQQAILSNHSNATNLTCLGPNPEYWIEIVFHQCVYNAKEEVGFILGLISVFCWICSSLPQLYENYKNGSVDEALSIWFLLLWLSGDSSNLIGCILTNQFPIQLYTAIYYVCMDIAMVLQYLYYTIKLRRRAGERGVITDALTDSSRVRSGGLVCCVLFHVVLPYALVGNNANRYQIHNSNGRIGRTLLSVEKSTHFIEWTAETIAGYTVGVISSAFYLGSRMPQILKNYRRGETEGVSPVMFALAVAGNLLYGSSILLQDPAPGHSWPQFIVLHLPWLIGSLGTLSLDLFILCQIVHYSGGKCCRRRIKPIAILEDDADNNPLLA